MASVEFGAVVPDVLISSWLPDGTSAGPLILTLVAHGESTARSFPVPNGAALIDAADVPLSYLEVFRKAPGFWDYCGFDVDSDQEIILVPLPETGPLGWWHEVHGISRSDATRGRGVRIGIVDEALSRQAEGSCIAHVSNLGHEPATGEACNRGFTPEVEHGEAVTSLIGSRCTEPTGYEGIAPGAELVFAAAGSHTSRFLSSPYVTNALDHLVGKCECDFISVSAGDVEAPLPDIHAAIQDAWDEGVLCFFASGNQGPDAELRYPACYPECVSVAAVGLRGFAPPGTEQHLHDYNSANEFSPSLYEWRQSSTVGLADFLAAGSNVIWTLRDRPARAVNGTSFASPIAAGVAASICAADRRFREMPRNRARSEYALQLLEAASIRGTGEQRYVGGKPVGARYGFLRIPVATRDPASGSEAERE